MAIRITEKTHPIAVASLPPGFAMIPKKEVLGTFLIINEISGRRPRIGGRSIDGRGVADMIAIGNSHMDEKDFFAAYKFLGNELPNQFTEVEEA